MAKPAFDPNKAFDPVAAPVSGGDKPAFDPNQPFEPAKPTMSIIDAVKVKGAEGATLGLRPVVAGLAASMGDLYNQVSDSSKGIGGRKGLDLGEAKDAFKEARHAAIAEQNQAEADHPTASKIALVGSGLLTAPLMPMASTLKGAMQVGTAMGAANAIGSAESLPEAVEKTGEGLAAGAAGYGVAKTAGAAASSAINNLAETKAFKAAGAMLKDFRAAYGKNPDTINKLGRTMLDNGLVKAGDTVESIAQKSDTLRRDTGKQIGAVYNKVLETLTSPESNVPHEVVIGIQEMGFHPQLQADEIKSVVKNELKGLPGSTAAINKASSVIDELALNGNNITPDHALELKGHVDAMINWSKKAQDLPLDQEALKVVRNYIQNRLTVQVQAMDEAVGSSQSKELVRLNGLYGQVATIANIAKDRVLREAANQSFGLTDKIVGASGMSTGALIAHSLGLDPVTAGAVGMATGAATGLANKAARSYGNAAVSSLADQVAPTLANPTTYVPLMSTTIRSGIGKKKQGD